MTNSSALKKVNALVNHTLCFYAKRSRRAYEMQEPTYFMGCFEAAYQFAYDVIDCETIQDAVDLLNDDIKAYGSRNGSYYNGYVHVAKKLAKTMHDIEWQFWYDYGIKSLWSLCNFTDLANAIN